MFTKIPETEEEYHIFEVGCDPDHPFIGRVTKNELKDPDARAYFIGVLVYVVLVVGLVVLTELGIID